MEPPSIRFEFHQAERRRRPSVTLHMGCCCCCCLHSVGSLIGAAIAPFIGSGPPPVNHFRFREPEITTPPPRPTGTGIQTANPGIGVGTPHTMLSPEEEDEDYPRVTYPANMGVSAVSLFWLLLLVLSLGIVVVGTSATAGNFLAGLFYLVLCLPAVQVASAFFVALFLLFSQRKDWGYQMKQLGKITLGLIVGTGAGILAMVLLSRGFR